MQSIRFYLRKKKNKAGQRPLHAVFNYNGERLEQTTKIMLRDIEWNSKSQAVTKECQMQNQVMQLLDNFRSRMIEFYLFGNNRSLNKEEFIKNLRSYLFPGDQVKLSEGSVLEYIDKFLDIQKRTNAADTHEKYYYFFNSVVKGFIQENYNNFEFQDFDMNFYDAFKIHLYEDRDYNNNSCSKAMDRLRTFLNWAAKRGYNQHATYLMYNRDEYKISTYNPSNISLTKEELQALISKKLDDEILDTVRKVFIFMCLTGQRKRDYMSLEWHHIKNGVWTLRQHKEFKEPIQLQLHHICLKILADFRHLKKPLPIDLHFNIKIKEVFRRLGVTEPYSKTIVFGGRRYEEVRPRCEFVTMHTARRTLVTISGEMGIRPSVGSKVTGHRDLKTYKLYDKQEDVDAMTEFNNTWSKNFNASQLA